MFWYIRRKYVLHVCMFIILILFFIVLYRNYFNKKKECEAFSQEHPFVLKENKDIYDEFYVDKYDDLFKTDQYSESDFAILKEHTKLNDSSVILDIGCGSGYLTRKLSENGYKVFGIENSIHMYKKCKKMDNNIEVFHCDVLNDSMKFDSETFSQILCTHFTIYEIDDKKKLLEYCYFWLKKGGELIIHVVEDNSFNKIVPKSAMYDIDKNNKVTNTVIKMSAYTYKNEFKNIEDNNLRQIETFTTDKYTRQNEKLWLMISKEEIIDIALQIGFGDIKNISYSEDMIKDKKQSLLIMTRV